MPDNEPSSSNDNLEETIQVPSGARSTNRKPEASGDSASSQASTKAPVPQFEDYEILEELGRGGMGVVYKARDRKLGRTVALKMIIGGQFASEAVIQRFRLEGEAAARLDHPGIVPIYEIGEVDGNHFFSMKFVDGGSLAAKSDEVRRDLRSAIGLLIKVAQAVQHAHQRGVLHRDLKPANILIDESEQPLVMDLGLAKQMDGESELTQTGLIMGTPGFMAPEQAEGRRDITTAADVFSLGAILYWLVTGSPPFQGETAVQTVMATLKGEAPSLRGLVPGADSDLDLICQKAMHRDPLSRYSSAAAFAEDLDAWLSGEPLSVRPPTAINVASIWVRKNLRSVLASCLTGLGCGLFVGGLSLVNNLNSIGSHETYLSQLGQQNAETWASWVTGFRHLSPNLIGLLKFLSIPAVAIFAVLNVLLVRPRSREANFISAVTAGLVAGVIAYLISFGWGPINASLARGSKDVQLLSDSIWLTSDAEKALAREALIQRYPGIEAVPVANRGTMITRKILHDQRVGIVPGMWFGIAITILFVALPMSFASIFSGMLWHQGERGVNWFFLTWERTAYCMLIFIVLAVFLNTVTPKLVYHLMAIGGYVAALIVALRQDHWLLRIAAFVVPMFLFFVMVDDMNRQQRTFNMAARAQSDDRLREVAELNDRSLSHSDSQLRRYRTAITWLYLGDEKRYQAHCEKMLAAFENAYRPEIAGRVAKVALLRPDLQDPKNLPRLHQLAEVASTFESSGLSPWFAMTRSISEQRQGNAREARTWNQRCRGAINREQNFRYLRAATHIVDALSWLDENNVDAAKESMRLGRENFEQEQKPSLKSGYDGGWVNRLVFLVLEGEATEQLAKQ